MEPTRPPHRVRVPSPPPPTVSRGDPAASAVRTRPATPVAPARYGAVGPDQPLDADHPLDPAVPGSRPRIGHRPHPFATGRADPGDPRLGPTADRDRAGRDRSQILQPPIARNRRHLDRQVHEHPRRDRPVRARRGPSRRLLDQDAPRPADPRDVRALDPGGRRRFRSAAESRPDAGADQPGTATTAPWPTGRRQDSNAVEPHRTRPSGRAGPGQAHLPRPGTGARGRSRNHPAVGVPNHHPS